MTGPANACPPGPLGPSGVPGKPGPEGSPGCGWTERKEAEDKGADAPQGKEGTGGEPGASGPQGVLGTRGTPGDEGPTGRPGPDAEYCPCPQQASAGIGGSVAGQQHYVGGRRRV
uniref:Collagen triple helix repeat protein n=1 Tax=Globodera pallida TaxID=36090 RepID=A0A183CG52_GLOPA